MTLIRCMERFSERNNYEKNYKKIINMSCDVVYFQCDYGLRRSCLAVVGFRPPNCGSSSDVVGVGGEILSLL